MNNIYLFVGVVSTFTISNIYICICKCFSLFDINNKIDVQFCMNTFDHVISFFFNAYEYNILASVYLDHCNTVTVNQCRQYTGCTKGKHIKKS